MRITSVEDERERVAFAERAAASFLKNGDVNTYADAEIAPGAFFAVRWGLTDRAVLVFRVGDDDPLVFRELVIPRDAERA